jgi:hypothetical protein
MVLRVGVAGRRSVGAARRPPPVFSRSLERPPRAAAIPSRLSPTQCRPAPYLKAQGGERIVRSRGRAHHILSEATISSRGEPTVCSRGMHAASSGCEGTLWALCPLLARKRRALGTAPGGREAVGGGADFFGRGTPAKRGARFNIERAAALAGVPLRLTLGLCLSSRRRRYAARDATGSWGRDRGVAAAPTDERSQDGVSGGPTRFACGARSRRRSAFKPRGSPTMLASWGAAQQERSPEGLALVFRSAY